MDFAIRSHAFKPGAAIPTRHTGDGDDVSPPLEWSGLPTGTVDLALIVEDPDAPTAEPWVHWIAYNIPADVSGLPEGFEGPHKPPGQEPVKQGVNTWGTVGWRGPAPPHGHGTHHYHFKLYALNAAPDLPEGLDAKKLRKLIRDNVLGQSELVGTYARR
jgi:Raf kinase inhibitor-like YbhB/YbcL family protein